MPTALELYDSYLRGLAQKHPEHVSLMRAAFRAYDAVEAGKPVTQELIQPIVDAASDSRKLLFEIPVNYLSELTGKYKVARTAVSGMANKAKPHVRHNAMMCIGIAAPREFKLQMLRKGLGDKSSKVRAKAADMAAFWMRLQELVPELEEAYRAEKNAKAKASIEFNLRLLRDGYILKAESDGMVLVTTFSGSTWVKRSELRGRGIEAIVAEIHANWADFAANLPPGCNPR